MKSLISLLIVLLLSIGCSGSITTTPIDTTDATQTTTTNTTENNLNSDVTIQTTIGEVSGLSIINIPYGTVYQDFYDGLTVNIKSIFEIFISDGITVATDIKSNYRVKVIAENGASETYILTVSPDPAIINNYNNFDLESDDYDVVGAILDIGRTEDNNSLLFNGDPVETNYMLIPYDENLDVRTTGSIKVWVKARTIVPFAGIVSKGQSADFSDEAFGIQLYIYEESQARLLGFVYNDAGVWVGVHGTFDIVVDEWYFIILTWDADNIKLYVNGVLDGTIENTTGGVKETIGGITVGAQLTEKYNETYGNLGWDGWIDYVQILDRTLTAEEILEEYNNTK